MGVTQQTLNHETALNHLPRDGTGWPCRIRFVDIGGVRTCVRVDPEGEVSWLAQRPFPKALADPEKIMLRMVGVPDADPV